MHKSTKRKAFTIIEMIIIVIGILFVAYVSKAINSIPDKSRVDGVQADFKRFIQL